jgi:hypothetical protein
MKYRTGDDQPMGKIGVFILGVVVGVILLPVLIINACT